MSPRVRAMCLGLALLGLGAGAAHAQIVTEFSAGITAGAGLQNITAGPDGNLWFTETSIDRIGRITPLGIVTEFSTGISAGSQPFGITAGPDGNLWFTEQAGIGRITPLGVVTEFSAGISAGAFPFGITAGPDGNLWFTEFSVDRIGRITPLGIVTEFSAGISFGAEPVGITAGPDGNLWFTEFSGNRIGRITPAGLVTEFTGIGASAITAGPDGNLWFTGKGLLIGRITPNGVVTVFVDFYLPGSVDGREPEAFLITAGPDGNLWYTGSFRQLSGSPGVVGRITPAGVDTEFKNGINAVVFGITTGPDGNLWFTEPDANRIGRITTGPATATSFHTTPPCRVLDTRNATGALGGPALAAGVKRDFGVTDTCGIPAAAVSISANVTIAEATSAGTLLVLPAQLPVLAFQAEMTRANNAFLLLSPDGSGTLSFSNDMPSGTVHLIVDVNGWWQ